MGRTGQRSTIRPGGARWSQVQPETEDRRWAPSASLARTVTPSFSSVLSFSRMIRSSLALRAVLSSTSAISVGGSRPRTDGPHAMWFPLIAPMSYQCHIACHTRICMYLCKTGGPYPRWGVDIFIATVVVGAAAMMRPTRPCCAPSTPARRDGCGYAAQRSPANSAEYRRPRYSGPVTRWGRGSDRPRVRYSPKIWIPTEVSSSPSLGSTTSTG
jgi:hypothetical protein